MIPRPLLRLPRTRGQRLATSTAELLHSSRIPTLHFQDSLPKLPVPALKATLKRLLSAAEPLVSAADLEETYRLVADFEHGGVGDQLQAQLIARDQLRYSSFISEPWFDMYLCDRAPLLLNYNPALCFNDDEGAAGSQVGRAARLVHASMTFLRTLETGNLEPDIFHTEPTKSKTRSFEEVALTLTFSSDHNPSLGPQPFLLKHTLPSDHDPGPGPVSGPDPDPDPDPNPNSNSEQLVRLLPRGVSFYGAALAGAYPLDMSQYANLFRSTRLPGATRDALQTYEGSRHVVVQHGNSFYEVQVRHRRTNGWTYGRTTARASVHTLAPTCNPLAHPCIRLPSRSAPRSAYPNPNPRSAPRSA